MILRFKQFIKENFLAEAKAEHFAHIGLDPQNPEHKDMVDAFNQSHQNLPKKNPNQYKSLDELKNAVGEKLSQIHQKRREDEEDRQAFEKGDAQLIHHNPENGVKVYKVKNQQGCAAVGSGTQWCTAQRGGNMMGHYDPSGEHSYVIHTPEKGNLSRIGIIGVKPGKGIENGIAGNFQDKGNNTVNDEDWDMLRKKYKLDDVKEMSGIRGLYHPEAEKYKKEQAEKLAKEQKKQADELVKPHLNDIELSKLADEHSHNPEVHKAILNHPNAGEESMMTVAYRTKDPEVLKSMLKNGKTKEWTIDVAVENADKNNYSDPDKNEIHNLAVEHPEINHSTVETISRQSNDPRVHSKILDLDPDLVNKHTLINIARRGNKTLHNRLIDHDEADHDVYAHVADHSTDPDIHNKILEKSYPGYEALDGIARNSNDPEILRKILNRKDGPSSEGLSYIAEKLNDPEVDKRVIKHENVASHLLREISKRSKDIEVHRMISKHPEAWDDTLQHLAHSSRDPETLNNIINHKNAPDFVKHMAEVNLKRSKDNPVDPMNPYK